MTPRLGMGFGSDLEGPKVVSFTKQAEAAGFESVWMPEHYFWRDAVSIISSAAAVTNKVKLALCVLNPYTRNPALISMTIASIDELSSKRAILGLGRSIAQWMEPMGLITKSPILHMKECVSIIQSLLQGDKVSFAGKHYVLKDVQLRFAPPRSRVPIHVAAMGPKMLRTAGAIADGVILTSCVPPSYISYCRDVIRQGAQEAGRSVDDIDLVAFTVTCVSDDVEKAKRTIRSTVAKFMALNNFAVPGLYEKFLDISPQKMERITKGFLQNRLDESANEVSDDMLEELALAGDRSYLERKIVHLEEAGATLPVLNLSQEGDLAYQIARISSYLDT